MLGADFSSIHDTTIYTYGELRRATENFSAANKVGQGGFGSVNKVIADMAQIFVNYMWLLFDKQNELWFEILVNNREGLKMELWLL